MLHHRARIKEVPIDRLANDGWLALVPKLAAGAAIYYLLALVCIYLSRLPHDIATMWLPDAFVSIYLLLLPRGQRIWLLALLALTIPLANLSYGDPWRIAVSFAPANLLQIALSALLLGRFVQPRLAIVDPWHLLKAITLAGLLPALAGASLATLTVPILAGTPLGPSPAHLWLSWLVSTFFGVATLLPMGLWVLARGLDFSSLQRPSVLATLMLVLLVCWGAVRWLPFPYAYVITTLAFAAVFGGFVAASMAALLASVALNASFALGLYAAPLPSGNNSILVVLPILIAVIPTVLIGAIREGLTLQIKRVSAGEAMQRSMLDASPNLLCLVDKDGGVVRMNAAGARMLGAEDAAMLVGRPFRTLVRLDSDGTLGHAEVLALDGRRLQAEWHREALHLKEHGGASVYALRDITAELEAQRMREQVTRSEAESRAKSEFLSRMGHELRTPLNAVLGYAQVLEATLHDSTPQRQQEHLQQISQAGWHLLAMIDDVLELARLEAGATATSSPRPVDLATLLPQACAMVQTEAARRSVRIEASSIPAGARVLADPLRLRQILINLLSNAVKYNHEGGQVHIDCTRRGQHWMLTVTDTGAGISEAQQVHVFEPFNRLDQDGSSITGTGIGLSITRKLVEAMNGQIGFHSQLNAGSSFWVTLPAA